MARTDYAEVATINREESFLAQSFSNGNHRVDEAKRYVSVLAAELPTAAAIGSVKFQDGERAVFNISKEGVEDHLGQTTTHQPVQFNNDRGRHNYPFRGTFHRFEQGTCHTSRLSNVA